LELIDLRSDVIGADRRDELVAYLGRDAGGVAPINGGPREVHDSLEGTLNGSILKE
jgi:hypothetical protein